MPFQKGVSGNPAGRKPGQMRAIQNLALEARKYAVASLRTIDEIRRKSESDAVRLAAANSLLDRGFGKPAQSVELAGELTMTHQTELFADMGIAEQRLLQDALRTIEHEDARLIEYAGGGDAEGADAEEAPP